MRGVQGWEEYSVELQGLWSECEERMCCLKRAGRVLLHSGRLGWRLWNRGS